MNLSEKAVLLGQLGKLMRCLALTQTQFERVKMLILKGDPRVTVELFSTLTAFREQRAAGILTDQEYNDLASEGLEDLMVDLDSSSTDAPTTVSSSYQASKRKRSDAAGRGQSSGRMRQSNVKKPFSSSHPAGSSCSQGGHQQPTDSNQRGETSCGLLGHQDTGRRKIVLSGTLGSNKPDEKLSEAGDNQIARRCSNRTGGSKNYRPSVTSEELLCFGWRRWTQTIPFTLPHSIGYCTDEGPLTIVDSTVDLLERAIPRPFPLYIGPSKSFKGSPPKVSFQKQAAMYCKLKKVLIRLGKNGEETAVYRATDKEVKTEVDEVSRKKISFEEYLLGVKKLRAGQQGS